MPDTKYPLQKPNEQEKNQEKLLNDAFIEHNNLKLQKKYIKLFQPTKELAEHLQTTLKKLQSNESSIRKQAAKFINSQARKEWSVYTRAWLRDPRTISLLIRSINQEDDLLTLAEMLAALAWIINRYFPDQRTYICFKKFLNHPNKKIRASAVLGIGGLKIPKKWEDLLPAFEDKVSQVKIFAVETLLNKPPIEKLPLKIQDELSKILPRLKKDKDQLLCMMAENALRKL